LIRESIRTSRNVNNLIATFDDLSRTVEHVAVVEGDYEERGERQLLDAVEMQTLFDAMRKADGETVGGHNRAIHECILYFELKDGSTRQLLGSVHKNQEGDLYLSDELWKETKTGYSKEVTYLVRVPNMGKWIIEQSSSKSRHSRLRNGNLDEKLDPAQVWLNQGNSLLQANKYHEAIEAYRRALELRPDWDLALGNIKTVELLLANYKPRSNL